MTAARAWALNSELEPATPAISRALTLAERTTKPHVRFSGPARSITIGARYTEATHIPLSNGSDPHSEDRLIARHAMPG